MARGPVRDGNSGLWSENSHHYTGCRQHHISVCGANSSAVQYQHPQLRKRHVYIYESSVSSPFLSFSVEGHLLKSFSWLISLSSDQIITPVLLKSSAHILSFSKAFKRSTSKTCPCILCLICFGPLYILVRDYVWI